MQWLSLVIKAANLLGKSEIAVSKSAYAGIQVSKKQNVSSLRTRKYPILWGPGPRGSELGTTPTWFEFRIMCLDSSHLVNLVRFS